MPIPPLRECILPRDLSTHTYVANIFRRYPILQYVVIDEEGEANVHESAGLTRYNKFVSAPMRCDPRTAHLKVSARDIEFAAHSSR